MAVEVSVKWGKEKYVVDLDTNDPPVIFKGQLFALTGVQPERQKIMIRGKTLGDDSWDNFKVAKGSTLMMIGSAEKVPEAPKQKTVFLEDLSDGQLANVLDVPSGLKNLGNTCYMNATLQCLKAVPELRDALKVTGGSLMGSLSGGVAIDGPGAITSAVRDLFRDMDSPSRRNQEIIPLIMLQVLHQVFPQFASKDDHGHLMQQDANECWVQLIRMLQAKLKTNDGGEQAASLIQRYFGGIYKTKMKCIESEEEPVSEGTEEFTQLTCYLSQEVKYLHSGLLAGLTDTREVNSAVLGRNAKYEKSLLIDRLPGYLSIQMLRFFYKEKDQVNAKILKDVKFPMILDVFDFCTPELKQKLMPIRDRFKIADDFLVEEGKAAKQAGKDFVPKEKQAFPYSFEDDPGSNNSGFYELQAVLTHKGRSSNSGHYVAWVRKSATEWIMCDDDNIHPVTEEDILKLSGGGDWHCAYVLVYGPRILKEVIEKDETPKNGNETTESTADVEMK